MRQAGIIAAGGIYALQNNLKRITEDHRRAKIIAETLDEIPNIRIDEVQTNIVVFNIAETGVDPLAIVDGLKELGLLIVWMGGTVLRTVCHLDVNDDDIKKACDIIRKYFNSG